MSKSREKGPSIKYLPYYCFNFLQRSKVYSKKCPPNWPRAESFQMQHDARLVYSYTNWCETLDISLGTCPTVFPSTTTAVGVAMVCLCSRLLHTVTRTLVHCFVICVRCRWTWTTRHHWQSRTSRLPSVVGKCVGVQYPDVGCDNVNMGAFCGKMQQCYKYPPTQLSEHKVKCTTHGPFFGKWLLKHRGGCLRVVIFLPKKTHT